MKKRIVASAILILFAVGTVWSQSNGYVMKRGEGELLWDGDGLIKASPRTGSQGAEMMWAAVGGSSGIHVHNETDEFFYVVGGEGMVLVSGQEVNILAGDVVFVPKGAEHRIRNSGSTEALELITLVDKSGLASEFRDHYMEIQSLGRALSLEELNRISERYGTTYLTLE